MRMRMAAGLAAALPMTTGVTVAQTAPAQVQAPARAVVADLRKVVAERYVLPAMAAKIDAAVAAGLAAGRYDGLAGEALAERLTQDMAAIARDKHLGVRHDPRMAAMLGSRGASDSGPPPAGMARMIRRANGAVRALEVFPGNIRYLAYDGFASGDPAAEEALATAMQFLKGGDAIIIDVRRNGGGSPQAVAAMTSYFLPAGTPLARFEMRGRPGETSVTPKAPFSLAGIPLYVLTSGGSASATEEFATHVSAFGFGTLVGETTAGAAYRNDLVPLSGGYILSVSTGRPVHAKTGGDWEAKGVAPRIAVAADAALTRAKAEAMAAIAAKAPADEQPGDTRLLAYYRAVAAPVAPALPVAAYAGRYGERVIALGPDGLTSRRGGGPASRMIAIAPDRFTIDADPTMHLRFVAEGERVTMLEVDRGQGPPARFERDSATR